MNKNNSFYKLISSALVLALIFYNIFGLTFYAVSINAQEATPTIEPSPSPSPEPTSAPTEQPSPTFEPTPTPFDPYNPPPYASEEYDVWKAQFEIWEAEQDALEEQADLRDDEWEANEEDQTWVDEHGGSEDYFVSGQWQKDQDAAAAAALVENNENQQTLEQTSYLCQSNDQDLNTTDSFGLGSTEADALSSESNTLNVSNDNCADISNDSSLDLISGQNSQMGNDGGVGMETGEVNGDGTVINQGNTNYTETDNFGEASASADNSFAEGSDATNLSTGDDSENFASASQTDTLVVDNTNTAYLDNQMNVEGVSGENTVVNNDGGITLSTGDIELIANMLNILNLNVTGDDFLSLIVNIFGTLTGDVDLDDIAVLLGLVDDDALEVIAENGDTGEDSQNTAEATYTQNTDIENTNNAVVNNEMNVNAVSGQNEVSQNDGGVDVITGRITILANLMNFINTNFSGENWSFYMINIFGSLLGDIILPGTDQYLDGNGGVLAQNIDSGDGSTNLANASSTETTNVTNTNNVTLTNTVNADGISGNNSESGNDDGEGEHSLETGVVDVATSILNFLNLNISGNNFVFLIVNVFGTWMGQIVGFGDGTINAPIDGTFASLLLGGENSTGVLASNSNTGEDSQNTANATSEQNTSVSNQNSAEVNNTMNLAGVSGENNVNQNDGAASLSSGWVEIDANLLNIINTNVTGNNWMFVFLNVFGDFMGDLFFGPKPAVVASAGGYSLGPTSNSRLAQNNQQNNNFESVNEDGSSETEKVENIALDENPVNTPQNSNKKLDNFKIENVDEQVEDGALVFSAESNETTPKTGMNKENSGIINFLGFSITNPFDSFHWGFWELVAIIRNLFVPIFAHLEDSLIASR